MTNPRSTALLTVLLAAAPAAAQSPYDVAAPAPPAFDREAVARQTRRLLGGLIGVDTRNPPGNELAAARLLGSAFEGVAGCEVEVLESGEGRGNLVVRLRAAEPSGRPGHLDVVGVQEEA